MTTKRSLNKLEWKAHMSIHNTMEVREGQLHPDACFTRDRFGKKQEIKKEEHSFRKAGMKALVFFVLIFGATGTVYASSNTNVQLESGPKDLSFLNEKKEPKERMTFYSDDNAAVDINDNGEPNLNMRF